MPKKDEVTWWREARSVESAADAYKLVRRLILIVRYDAGVLGYSQVTSATGWLLEMLNAAIALTDAQDDVDELERTKATLEGAIDKLQRGS